MSTPTHTRPDSVPSNPPDPFTAWEPNPPADGLASRLSGVVKTRRVPYLLVGVLLVLSCTTGGVVAALRLGQRQTVWALAQPVTVGHQLTAADLRQIEIAAGGDLAVVPARSREVLGRPLAYSLPAGTLLTRAELGASAVPQPGQAFAAVALKPGQFPPDLAAGARVAVVTTTTSGTNSSASASAGGWSATVVGARPAADGGETIVSLQLPDGDARQLAAAPAGSLTLVALSNGAS